MTETEDLMIDVIAELTLARAPIVFKGAMTLKLALAKQKSFPISRDTKDLDGDWMLTRVTMDQMEDFLSNAIHNIDPSLSVIPFRAFDKNKSAGFRIVNRMNQIIFKIDLGIRPAQSVEKFDLFYKGKYISIHGASINKMLADKICAISSPKVFRRSKDLVDAYILSHTARFNFLDVFRLAYTNGKKLEDFHAFRTNKEDIEHAYEKLHGVKNKPAFSALYERLETFLAPFIEKKLRPLAWTGETWAAPQRNADNTKNLGR